MRLTVSARTPEALRELASAYAGMVDEGNAAAVCAAVSRHRELFQHRLTVSGAGAAELRRKLAAMADEGGVVDAAAMAEVQVELPLYPFQHERYWLDHGWDPASDVYRMEWVREPEVVGAAETVAGLEAEAARYAREAVARVGVVLPKYDRLMRRLREIADGPSASAVADGPEARLLARCGPRVAEVLEGRVDAVSLLFPDGDFSATTAIYCESAGARLMNRRLAELVAGAAGHRILEVGAGTGSATAELLPAVAGRATEYWFTDVSTAFVGEARSTFAAYDFVRYGTLDLDREPEAQGFAAGSFDVIVAANVVHATRDLEATMRRLRRLLAPGGVVLLQEGLKRLGWQDLTFGLTDGWWAFRDTELRSEHPMIGRAEWLGVLERCGFDEGQVESYGAEVFGQGIVSARASAGIGVVLTGERDVKVSGRVVVGTTRAGARLERVAEDRWVLDAADPEQVQSWISAVRRTARMTGRAFRGVGGAAPG